jgi:hypothetical protein
MPAPSHARLAPPHTCHARCLLGRSAGEVAADKDVQYRLAKMVFTKHAMVHGGDERRAEACGARSGDPFKDVASCRQRTLQQVESLLRALQAPTPKALALRMRRGVLVPKRELPPDTPEDKALGYYNKLRGSRQMIELVGQTSECGAAFRAATRQSGDGLHAYAGRIAGSDPGVRTACVVAIMSRGAHVAIGRQEGDRQHTLNKIQRRIQSLEARLRSEVAAEAAAAGGAAAASGGAWRGGAGGAGGGAQGGGGGAGGPPPCPREHHILRARGETVRRRIRAMWKTAVRVLGPSQDVLIHPYARFKDARGRLLNQSLFDRLLKEVRVVLRVLKLSPSRCLRRPWPCVCREWCCACCRSGAPNST